MWVIIILCFGIFKESFGFPSFAFPESLNIRLINFWGEGPPVSIEVDSPFLYVGEGRKIVAFDVSEPSAPLKTGEMKNPFCIYDHLFSKNDTLFSGFYNEISVIDFTDPFNPAFICSIPYAQNIKSYLSSLFVRDSVLFICSYYKGVQIYNIRNLPDFYRIGYFDTTKSFWNMILMDTLMLLKRSDSVYVVNIKDLTNPTLSGVIFFPSNFYRNRDTIVFSIKYSYPLYFLEIYNFSNPLNPIQISSITLDTFPVFDLLPENNYLYITKACSLIIYDITDLSLPHRVSGFSPPGSLKARGMMVRVKKEGIYLYLMDSQNGIHIVNIQDISFPQEIGFIPLSGNTYDIVKFYNRIFTIEHRPLYSPIYEVLEGSFNTFKFDSSLEYLGKNILHYPWRIILKDHFAIVNEGGIYTLYEICAPLSGREIGSFDTPDYARGVYVSGNYAYVADDYGGLRVIDISDTANIYEAGFYETGGRITDVWVDYPYAIIVENPFGIRVLNISVPDEIVEISNLQTIDARKGFYEYPYYYLADGNGGFKIISLENILNPQIVGSLNTDGRCDDIYIYGNFAYAADGPGGFKIFDISNPSSPSLIFSFPVNYWAIASHVSSGYAYFLDYVDGLFIFDISNPYSPVLITNFDPFTGYNHIEKSGPSLFISASGSIKVINVSCPENPYIETSINLGWEAHETFIDDNILYVANGIFGLRLFEIWEPLSIPSKIPLPFTQCVPALDWEIKHDILYWTGYGVLLEVIDITYPWDPVVLGRLNLPSGYYGLGMDMQGNYIYVNDYSSFGTDEKVYIIDVSTSQPQIVATIPLNAMDVAVKGEYLYIATFSGIHIYSVQDPSNPQYLSTFLPDVVFSRIKVKNGLLYVIDGTHSLLRIFDITQDPLNPPEMGYYPHLGNSPYIQFYIDGRYIYLPCYSFGFDILKYEGPIGIREPVREEREVCLSISAISPSKIHYYLPYEGKVCFQIFDICGRKVWEYRRRMNPGYYSLKLPELSSGTYFLKGTLLKKIYKRKFLILH